MLNAVELGTVVAIHRRVAKDECFVVLRGKVRVTTHNDGAVIGDVGVSQESGGYGVDVSGGELKIAKNVGYFNNLDENHDVNYQELMDRAHSLERQLNGFINTIRKS